MVERSIFEKLVYIGAVSQSESSNVHLVGVTSAGKLIVIITTVILITVVIIINNEHNNE